MTARRVLITGASKGIGLAVAERLRRQGHAPIGLARTAPERFPGDLRAVDLADAQATLRVLDEVLVERPLDGVVNNVGLVRPAMLGDLDIGDLADVYDLTVRVAVQVTQAALPGMRAAGRGRIVNISSLVTTGTPEPTAYGAAKAALEFCTRPWATELATTGITANTIAPGPTETELLRANNPPGSPGERRYLASVPAGRFGHPAEMAGAVSFLLSDHAAFITGQTLRVDGGASVGSG